MNTASRRCSSPPYLLCLVASLWLASPAHAWPSPKPTPSAAAPEPVPGNPLELYTKRYAGLHKTGGLAIKRMAAGYEFEIYEGKRGEEHQFSPTFLPGDPTDSEGVIYLPRLSLVVMRTPDDRHFVLSETKQVAFEGSKALKLFLNTSEKAAAMRIPAAANLMDTLNRWYVYNFQGEKSYHVIHSDGHVKIMQAMLDGGTIGSLLLLPDWDELVTDDAEGKSKVGGVLKRVDYVVEYQKIALDNLYRFVKKPVKK